MSGAFTIDPADIQQLLASVSLAAVQATNLADRRRLTLLALGDIIDADAGHWAWGRGHPLTEAIAPVAIIDFGYTPEQRTMLVEHALHPKSVATFQARVVRVTNGRRQATVTRRDVLPDDEWRSSDWWSKYVERLGLDSWLHAVTYRTDDVWACLHFLRRTGRAEFEARERTLVDLALESVAWLQTHAEERVPADVVAALTPRQRTVMLLLLDGMARREIAAQLSITEHTVDDHLKAIYGQFGVRSVGELAAKFLRMA